MGHSLEHVTSYINAVPVSTALRNSRSSDTDTAEGRQYTRKLTLIYPFDQNFAPFLEVHYRQMLGKKNHRIIINHSLSFALYWIQVISSQIHILLSFHLHCHNQLWLSRHYAKCNNLEDIMLNVRSWTQKDKILYDSTYLRSLE